MSNSTGHGEKRSRREDAAIAALIACTSIGDAAKASGVSEATLGRWLREPGFQERRSAARRGLLEATLHRLTRAMTTAIACLERNLSSGAPGVELQAARTLLDHGVRALELLDLSERVARLETRRDADEQATGAAQTNRAT